MPRKKLTPAEKKAWGAKMKAAREEKARERAYPTPDQVEAPRLAETPPPLEVSESAPETISQDDDVEAMKRRLRELESYIFNQPRQPQATGPQVTQRGTVVGTLEKFPVDPKHYPAQEEIFERLLNERRLTLQGFGRDWWDIEYEVSSVNYDTKDGLNVTEPKFQVRLIRIIPHPETNEPSNRRYTLHKLTLFEDPRAAVQTAREHGLEVDEANERRFLDEMRYLRIRDWVIESFYPPKPTQDRTNKREEVIGNRLVEVFEANSTDPVEVPFNQMKNRT